MLKFKKLGLLFLIAVTVLTPLMPYFTPEVSAQEAPLNDDAVKNGTFRFIARDVIIGTLGGKDFTFVDTDPTDATNRYEIVDASSICDGYVAFPGGALHGQGAPGGSTEVAMASTVDIDVGPDCRNTDPNQLSNITVYNAENLDIWFLWQNTNTILLVGRGSDEEGQFIRIAPDSRVFKQNVDDECADKLIVTGTSFAKIYRLDGDGSDFSTVSPEDLTLLQPGNCNLYGTRATPNLTNKDPYTYLIGRTENAAAAPEDNPLPGGASEELEEDNSCETRSGALGWILCPVILIMDSALNWLDTQIQSLLSIDENKYNDDRLYVSWKQIRNISYIVLVPIMLVMVIGTAIGVEAFSAYTVKRALPRMVAAVIFITFSWYIVTFIITFFNVVGNGILGLLTAPFSYENGSVSTLSLADLFDVGFAGTVLAQATIAVGVFILLWLFLGTIVLMTLIAFAVLLIRQIFIIALMLIAPLAILAWIFPGNDKLWKMWWNAFTKLLMMYPIIMAVIAVGRIFAVIIMNNQDGVTDDILRPIMGVMAYVLPYAFIPFTFKLAGGFFGTLTGMMNDKSKGLFDRSAQSRAHKLERTGRKVLQKRANTMRRLESYGSGAGFIGKNAARIAAKGVGGYNMEAAMSARNAQVAKELNEQIATGKDDDIRGLTVNKKAADAYVKQFGWKQAEEAGIARMKDGKRQYQSLGGAWVDEANVNAGKARWGNDRFAQQAALSYEMRKAMTNEQVGNLGSRYGALTKEWGMTDSEAAGAWIGAAFENQNQHLEFKGMQWDNGKLKSDGADFVNEVYEKKGSYQLSQMSGHTIRQLSDSYSGAQAVIDQYGNMDMSGMSDDQRVSIKNRVDRAHDTQRKIKSVAETFVQRSGGQQGMAGEGDNAVPVFSSGGGGANVSAPGSAHVNEEVQRLAELTRVGPYGQNGGGAPRPAGPQGPQTPPAPGTYRDNDGNTRQSGGPGGGGVILGG